MYIYTQTVYCWGSQCFPSVSALAGTLYPPPWSCLSLVSSLSPIWSGMLCPPGWSCLSLVSGLVSRLVPSGLGCCVRLPGLVFLLSPVLSPSLAGMLCPPSGLSPRFSLSPMLSFPPGLRCCARLLWLVSQPQLVSGLVSHLVTGKVEQKSTLFGV